MSIYWPRRLTFLDDDHCDRKLHVSRPYPSQRRDLLAVQIAGLSALIVRESVSFPSCIALEKISGQRRHQHRRLAEGATWPTMSTRREQRRAREPLPLFQ